ncbi:MAG: nuclear transport factor 2 family protein [Chitinophagales bacterium]
MYKLYLCLLLAVLALFGCNTTGKSVRVQLALSWMDAMNRHDTTALASFYADSASVESPNWEGVKTGQAAMRTIYRRYFSSTPDLEQKITHLVSNDSCLVIEYDSWGTLDNPEQQTPEYMRGKKYLLHNCTRMTFQDGKIIQQKTYFDQVSFLRQMGFFEEH